MSTVMSAGVLQDSDYERRLPWADMPSAVEQVAEDIVVGRGCSPTACGAGSSRRRTLDLPT